jgi:hypothetical protein
MPRRPVGALEYDSLKSRTFYLRGIVWYQEGEFPGTDGVTESVT